MKTERLVYLLLLTAFFTYPKISIGQTDSTKLYQEVGRDNIDSAVSIDLLDQLPQFPGGIQGWTNFLTQNIKYPEQAIKKNITGKVVLRFIIEKDGSLSGIKVIKRIGGGCDEEAKRVLRLSPLWKPGAQHGKLVRVMYTLPISFNL